MTTLDGFHTTIWKPYNRMNVLFDFTQRSGKKSNNWRKPCSIHIINWLENKSRVGKPCYLVWH